MQKPIISADSHITEPAGTCVARIDLKYKDTAPHMVRDSKLGDVFVIKDIERPLTIGLAAAAGKSASELAIGGVKFEETHRGGWAPDARMADQDRDGVAAEIIYPTVGMLLCNHKDFDYKKPASTLITCGSPSTARRIRSACSESGRPRCVRRPRASRTCAQ